MPKYEQRKMLYWITWEENSLIMKFCQFMPWCHITKKKKIIKKLYKKYILNPSSRHSGVYKELSTTSISKWNF